MRALIKIILVAVFFSLAAINPGAVEENPRLENDLRPENIRLLNSDSQGEGFDNVVSSVTGFMHKWSVAGASMAIAKDGKLVYARGFGYSDTIAKTEVQPYSLFRIASISKLVTAVAVMKLSEEGKLSLDAKVFGQDGILNDPFFDKPKDKRVFDITVGHLLSHESGWTQRYGDQMFMPLVIADEMKVRPPVDLKTIVRFALDKKLHYTPGASKAYSNLGYSILGMVIEKVSGMKYQEYCRKEVLEPLGIYDMKLAHNLSVDKAPFEVSYYETSAADPKLSIFGNGELVPEYDGGNDIETLGSAGAWLADASDLMRLLLAIDGFDTKPDMLSSESISFMTNPENGFAPVGWKSVNQEGIWYRTGSFSGTAGVMKRQPDGIAWVLILNTSSWIGPDIYSYIDKMMTRAIASVSYWPDVDLFDRSLPLPVDLKDIAIIKRR